MNAAEIARALGGKRTGGRWIASCPVPGHGRGRGDRNPSLSIADGADGRPLVRCHGGCDQRDVISALRERDLWPEKTSDRRWRPAQDRDDNATRALALWRRSRPPEGSPVEAYLRHRGYSGAIPPTIRYAPDLPHPTGGRFPALIAAVVRVPSRRVLAVHRIWIAPDGVGKAPVKPAKMSLGPVGGGAVRLAPADEHVAVSEGIEDGLSILAATGLPVWAALSAGGIKSLILPPLPMAATVIIAADHDPTGIAAAQDAAERWMHEGRTVRIAVPDTPGADFNDLALAPSVRREVAA